MYRDRNWRLLNRLVEKRERRKVVGVGEAAVRKEAVEAPSAAAAATTVGIRSSRVGSGSSCSCGSGCRLSNNEPVHVLPELLEYSGGVIKPGYTSNSKLALSVSRIAPVTEDSELETVGMQVLSSFFLLSCYIRPEGL